MVKVYVPAPGSHTRRSIADGSGIVGTMEGQRLLIDYEGNLYHAANVKTFADRVDVAYGRHKTHYPTVARMLVDPLTMVEVGTYDNTAGLVLVNADDNGYKLSAIETLSEWIGVTLSQFERNDELWTAGR